jgi:type IV pilus assembly protein PilX
MRNHPFFPGKASKQNGVILFVALILLLILSLLGVTAARMQTVEERMARNEDNHQVGAEAAEAALRSAENGLLTGLYVNFAGNTAGLYEPLLQNGSPVTPNIWGTAGATLPYTGPAMSYGPAPTQVTPTPKIVIENLPSVAVPGQDLSVTSLNPASPPVTVYRVSAQAVGADNTSTTTLQSIFR